MSTGRRARRAARGLALAVLLALVAAPAAAPLAALPLPRAAWLEVRSPHFRVVSSAGERKSREIAITLERFRAALERLRPSATGAAGSPLTVLAFDGDRQLDPYKPTPDALGRRSVGTFQRGRFLSYILLDAFSDGDTPQIVYHEYVHAYLESAFGRLPLWVNEGLAEYYSTFVERGGGVEIGRPRVDHARRLRTASFLPFARLFAVEYGDPEYAGAEQSAIFYAQSWLLVHYLLSGAPELAPRSSRLLAALAAGTAAEAAVPDAFGFDLATLEAKLRGYVRQGSLPFARVRAIELGPDPELAVGPVAQAEALLELGTMLADRSPDADPTPAIAHLEAALALAPGDGDVCAQLAALRQRQGRSADAAALFAVARRGPPQRPVSYLLLAEHELPPGSGAAAADGERVARARSDLEHAVALAPDFGEAQARLGAAWLTPPDADPARAVASLRRAIELLPARADIAYNLVVAETEQGHLDAARQVIAARLSGDAALARAAREAVQQAELEAALQEALAAEDGARALALLDQAIAATGTAEVRAQLVERRATLAVQVARNRAIDRFNEAVGHANAGHLTAAAAILRELLSGPLDEDLATSARALLAQLE